MELYIFYVLKWSQNTFWSDEFKKTKKTVAFVFLVTNV